MKAMLPAILCAAAGMILNAQPVTETRTFPRAAVEELNRTPRAELPARAASLVARTPAPQQESMAVALVGAVALKHPGALLPVVASVATVATNAAPAIAAAAAGTAPDLAADIASVALQAAPPLAGRIIDSVQAVAPRSHAALMRLRANRGAGQPRGLGSHQLGRKGHPGNHGEGEGHDRGGGEGNEDHDHDHGPHQYNEP